jgi:hypothetical protein
LVLENKAHLLLFFRECHLGYIWNLKCHQNYFNKAGASFGVKGKIAHISGTN